MPSRRQPIAQEAEPEQASYLVLQVGIPTEVRIIEGRRADGSIRTRQHASSHIRRIKPVLEQIGVTVDRFNVKFGTTRSPHYLVSFRDYQRRDADSLRLVEAFAYGLSIVGAPLFQTEHPLVFRVPSRLANSRAAGVNTLLEIEKLRSPDDRSLPFPRLGDFTDFSTTTDFTHEQAWKVAAVTFSDDRLFEATRFLQRSFECFFVYPGGTEEVAYDEQPPQSASIRSRFEDALHNSFKAVEAIIGDPPKDDRRLSQKLSVIGIDWNEQVGYRVKEPIGAVIRLMSSARDKKSAHGSTPNRLITPGELLEFQACAQVVVVAGLESKGVDFDSA